MSFLWATPPERASARKGTELSTYYIFTLAFISIAENLAAQSAVCARMAVDSLGVY